MSPLLSMEILSNILSDFFLKNEVLKKRAEGIKRYVRDKSNKYKLIDSDSNLSEIKNNV